MTRQEVSIPFTIKRHHIVSTITLILDTNEPLNKEYVMNEVKLQARMRGELLATVRRSRRAEDLTTLLFPEWEVEP